jgi:hypothetical protein
MKSKFLLLIAFTFCTTIAANAQIKEGEYILGGAINFNNSKYPGASSSGTTASISNIQFGKVIDDNSVIGIVGSVSGNNNKGFKIYQYSAGIFYRNYKSLSNNFYFFWETDASFQHSSNMQTFFSDINQNLETQSNGVAFNFIPGLSYSVSKKFQVELSMPNIAGISYTGISTIESDLPPGIQHQSSNNFSANINLSNNILNNFGIGFKFFIGK